MDNVPWSLAAEVELFNGCDVGVYPWPTTNGLRKCGFKAIEFMSCGTQCRGGGRRQSRSSRTASTAFASTEQEWIDKVGRLLADPDLRRAFGAAGRRTVESGILCGRRRQARRHAARRRRARWGQEEDGMTVASKNFALTGAAGFVAPRHLKAIKDTGNRLIAAVDPHDAVGVLDKYFFDVRFFTEIERFDRHLEKLRRGPEREPVDYVSVCSPNYLHDAHIRLALRVGAHAICEKPLVINPWNLDALKELEQETGCRAIPCSAPLHRSCQLRERIRREPASKVTSLWPTSPSRRWYDVSWKGSE